MNFLKTLLAVSGFYFLAWPGEDIFGISAERSCIYLVVGLFIAHLFNEKAHIPWSKQ